MRQLLPPFDRVTRDGRKISIAVVLFSIALLAIFHIITNHENIKTYIQGVGYVGGSNPAETSNGKQKIGSSLLDDSPELLVSSFRPKKKLIVFPNAFPRDINLEQSYSKAFGVMPANAEIIRYNQHTTHKAIPKSRVISQQSSFIDHSITLFSSFVNIDNNMDECKQLQSNLQVQTGGAKSLDQSLTPVLTRFRDGDLEYYQDLKPFIGKDLDKQIKDGTVDKYWSRLAGSSVWLEQYGVHYMISRVIFAKEKVRNKPFVSLIYVQLFNENWEELKDTTLVLPSNDPAITNEISLKALNNIHYKATSFPYFLPIAHHINDKYQFYGPEDPRILLIKNANGYEEPLLVFNAYHRRVQAIEAENQDESKIKFKHFRSMFMCWPWQYQLGKKNVDGISDEKYSYKSYSRVHELERSGINKVQTQKNWTPFISYEERVANGGFDQYIYFVYRWSKVEILRCELSDLVFDHPLRCNFQFKTDHDLDSNSGVGAMRGGTQLINIGELINDAYKNGIQPLKEVVQYLPPDREIWIGIARAHVADCGCGADMYRPNLGIITKDREDFKIHLISSFFSLDVDVIGWELDKPEIKCVDGQPNVYIPNGISAWYLEKSSDKLGFTDYMTMSFSLADSTCHIIHVKGILSSLFKLDSYNKEKLFEKSTLSHNVFKETGFNDDNVECALAGSKEFCKAYGDVFETQDPYKEEKEKAEKEKQEKEKQEKEKQEKEKQEKEKQEREKLETDKEGIK